MDAVQVGFWVVVMLVVLAIAFDFMNGFHDAANSSATVLSTGVLKPQQAVLFAAFFNVVAIFFFQGLGIIHQVLIFLRVGLFWQVFLVLFLVVQLFLFVSCIGLADYWLDLRLRLIKWRQSRLETYKRREK